MDESEVADLKATINDLSNNVEKAETRAKLAEKQAETRQATIEKLKEIHTNAINDFEQTNNQLKLRNDQINSLKQTIKELQKQITDLNSEKQELNQKIDNASEVISEQNIKIDQYTKELEISGSDLCKNPKYKALSDEIESLKEELTIQNEARVAALSAWQKLDNQMKNSNTQNAEKESNYLDNVQQLKIANEELQQETKWINQKLINAQQLTQETKTDNKNLTEENIELKMRITTLQTEIRSVSQLEEIKRQTMTNQVMTECKWREHLLIQQLEKYRQELNQSEIQKIKYHKALRTIEVEQNEQQNNMRSIRPVVDMSVQRKYKELDELDAEINKLKKDLKQNKIQKSNWNLPPITLPIVGGINNNNNNNPNNNIRHGATGHGTQFNKQNYGAAAANRSNSHNAYIQEKQNDFRQSFIARIGTSDGYNQYSGNYGGNNVVDNKNDVNDFWTDFSSGRDSARNMKNGNNVNRNNRMFQEIAYASSNNSARYNKGQHIMRNSRRNTIHKNASPMSSMRKKSRKSTNNAAKPRWVF